MGGLMAGMIIDFQTRRILTRPILLAQAYIVPAQPLLEIKPSDLESIVTAPGGFLAWENGSSCDYRVQWDEDGREGSLFLWFPKEQVELWLVRSPKLGLVTLKCYHCRHKTNKSRWMYIHLPKGRSRSLADSAPATLRHRRTDASLSRNGLRKTAA